MNEDELNLAERIAVSAVLSRAEDLRVREGPAQAEGYLMAEIDRATAGGSRPAIIAELTAALQSVTLETTTDRSLAMVSERT